MSLPACHHGKRRTFALFSLARTRVHYYSLCFFPSLPSPQQINPSKSTPFQYVKKKAETYTSVKAISPVAFTHNSLTDKKMRHTVKD